MCTAHAGKILDGGNALTREEGKTPEGLYQEKCKGTVRNRIEKSVKGPYLETKHSYRCSC